MEAEIGRGLSLSKAGPSGEEVEWEEAEAQDEGIKMRAEGEQ